MTESGWALPEAAPVDQVDRAIPSVDGMAAPVVERPIPRLAVFDRPLTLADVLDGAFAVIKERPRAVITIAAAFVIPLGIVVAVADIGVLGGDTLATLTDPDTYEEGNAGADSDIGLTLLSTIVSSALVTAMAAPIARLVEAWYQGRDPAAWTVIRSLGWGWVSIAIGFVLVHVIEAVATAVLVLPGIVAMALLSVTAPAIAVERIGPMAGIRRSMRLVRPRFWATLWVVLLVGLVSGTLGFVLPLLPVAITSLVGFGGEQYVIAAGTVAASLVTLPFVAAAAVLLYFDLRVRTEGLDIQLALTESFGPGGAPTGGAGTRHPGREPQA